MKEDQFKALRNAFPGIDMTKMEKQFVAWNAEKGVTPDNCTGELYGFIKSKRHREARTRLFGPRHAPAAARRPKVKEAGADRREKGRPQHDVGDRVSIAAGRAAHVRPRQDEFISFHSKRTTQERAASSRSVL